MSDILEGGEGHTPVTVEYRKPWDDHRIVVHYDERGTVKVTREMLETLLAAAHFHLTEPHVDPQS